MSDITCKNVLDKAGDTLRRLRGTVVDVVDVKKPDSLSYAINLSKVVSKLSPLIGNMIEYQTCDVLNELNEGNHIAEYGTWIRQDPGFPDTVFQGKITPTPGIEIKTWFPLATEITARFKDSQKHFAENQTNVCMVAWLPEWVFFGRPKILDVFVDTAISFAEARDTHYHQPPKYIIFEPEDTSERTRNLQQTNTNGYRFQGTTSEMEAAEKLVKSWGDGGSDYSYEDDYQEKLRELMGQFKYRLDTNYAKMDRIEHIGLEEFKTKVLGQEICGYTISDWVRIISSEDKAAYEKLLALASAAGEEEVGVKVEDEQGREEEITNKPEQGGLFKQ